MQEEEQTAQDIFNRNNHTDVFRIKIPSHNASKQALDLMAHAYVLNKISLLPFYDHEKLAQLYKLSLQFLINSEKELYKNPSFVGGIVTHLVRWQTFMGIFGTWPYTRAAFYSIEEKIKSNIDQLEEVVLQRSLLQSNKQEFLNKSQNMNFKSSELKLVAAMCNNKEQNDEQNDNQFQLPQDIFYRDTDQCWLKLNEEVNNGTINKEKLEDYLLQYDRTYAIRFVKKNMGTKSHKQIKESLKLRMNVFATVIEKDETNLGRYFGLLDRNNKNN